MLVSTKRFGPISTCHRNWKALANSNRDSRKCGRVHGYSRYIEFKFCCNELDDQDWVMDFGNLKWLKQWLEDQWDHKVIVSSDDPDLAILKQCEKDGIMDLTIVDVTYGWSSSIEGNCKWVYDTVNSILTEKTKGRVQILSLRIWEHENNSVEYSYSPNE